MIQKLTINLILIFISISSFGQVKVDPRIQEFLGEEIIRKIVTEHPNQLKYYNTILFESYKLIELSEIESEENLLIETIAYIPLKNGDTIDFIELENQINDGTFNIFQIKLRRNKSTNRYFRIGNGSKIFVLIAEEKLK